MACAGRHFFWPMVVDANQSVVSLFPIIPDGSLLAEQPKSVAFELSHQLAEPQNAFNLSPFYRPAFGGRLWSGSGLGRGRCCAALAYSSESGSTSITKAVAGHLRSCAKARTFCNSAFRAMRLADLMRSW